MSFVHLHNHSHYSLLQSTIKIKDMVERASQLGMHALALTDSGNLFGALEFYSEAKKAGIKPIIGMEAYVAPRKRNYRRNIVGAPHSYHLVLLVKNQTGFKNLIKLSSKAYLEGMYYKPRIDKEILKEFSEGIIATSACINGEIPYKLKQGLREQAITAAKEYLKIFGDDFYFEIQNHRIPEETAIFQQVYDLAQEMNIPVVATNNNHYLNKGDHDAHDILLCLYSGKDRNDPNRIRYTSEELYLKSAVEIQELFKDKPEVLENTLKVSDKCNLEIDYPGSFLSNIRLVNGNEFDAKKTTGFIRFEKLTAKKAIRDVSRVLKIPIQQADTIAGFIPIENGEHISLHRAFTEVPELKEIAKSEDLKLKELAKVSQILEGINRSVSREASGSTLISDDIPLYKNNNGEIVTQWALESARFW